MCRKKKKVAPPVAEPAPVNPLDSFELKKPEPAFDANGNRDYFTEYYNAYKNDYIDQYLDAYKKFKAEGVLPEYSPIAEAVKSEESASDEVIKDEIDV